MSDLDRILAVLKEATGLEVKSVGAGTVERSVRLRMSEIGVDDLSEYLKRLKSQDELQELINRTTVPETWFCRDHEPFKLLSDYVSRAWTPEQEGEKFRVLSVPSSTGEEPYSIAMMLLEAGLAADEMQIDAVDINSESLKKARAGLYGDNSFRGDVALLRNKYFVRENGRYRIKDKIRSLVSFSQDNLVSPKFTQDKQPYHAIFCRNLLIYFDLPTKQKAIRSLHRLLRPEGLLFVGHAETGRVDNDLFSFLRHPGAFAYQRVDGKAGGDGRSAWWRGLERFQKDQRRDSAVKVKLPATVDTPPKSVAIKRAVSPVTEEVSREGLLAEIERLADLGELNRAETLCNEHIKQSPEDAQGYYMMGVISVAADDVAAAEGYFRKALFLKPDHYKALAHMANLVEAQGNEAAASSYRRRLQSANDSGGM